MKYLLVTAFIFSPSLIFAHLPRMVNSDSVKIEQPEISQVFYGELKDKGQSYHISEHDSFEFYLQLLVPDIPGQRTDFVWSVYQESSGDTVFSDISKGFQWTKYYEPYGGDHYLKGPEIEIKAAPGNYIISVSNIGNNGKYALVVGKKEYWPFKEILKTLQLLPEIKQKFFLRSPLTAYFNLVGLFLLVLLIILFLIPVLVISVKRRRKRA